MIETKFIVDTNVIVSALLIKKSISRQALDKAFRQGKLLISTATLEELNAVLKRKKFNKYLSETKRIQFLTSFVEKTTMVTSTKQVLECRDPKDNKFLELALTGNATCIITGDKDLLILHPFQNIDILTPSSFLES